MATKRVRGTDLRGTTSSRRPTGPSPRKANEEAKVQEGPVTFRYRGGTGKEVETVRGVHSVSGEIPAHSDTYYVIFYDILGAQIGRCA